MKGNCNTLQDGYYLVAKIEDGIIKPLQIHEDPTTQKQEASERGELWCGIDSVAYMQGCKVSDILEYGKLPENIGRIKFEDGFWYVRTDFYIPPKQEKGRSVKKKGENAYTWMTVSDFSKKNGISRSAVHRKRTSGVWDKYFKTIEGHIYVRSDLPIRKHGGAPISVHCEETGNKYKSINDACRAVGLTYPEVKRSLETGKKCGGYHFTYA